MAKYRVQGPDGATHVFEGPDDATQEQVLAAAQAQFGQSAEQLATPAKEPGMLDRAVNFVKKDLAAIPGRVGNLAAGAVRGAGSIGATVLAPVDAAARALGVENDVIGRTDRREAMDGGLQEMGADTDSGQFQAAKLATEIAGTSGAGGLLAKGMAAVPGLAAKVPALVNAVRTSGMTTGNPAATTIAGRAGDLATRAAGGAITGGAQAGMIDPGSAGTGAAIGVALPPALAAVGKAGQAVGAAGRTAKAIAEPLHQGGREAIAGRTLRRAAGDSVDDVITRLAGATEVVPGSLPSAAQVAESGGMAALERTMAAAQPEEFAKRGMDQAAARTQALRGIAGDEASRAAAVAARGKTTRPLYAAAASKEIPVDSALQDLLKRPSVQQALERARNIAKEEGRTFDLAGAIQGHAHGNPAGPQPIDLLDEFGGVLSTVKPEAPVKTVTGQTLQDLKMALDAMLKDPTSGIAGKEATNIAATRGQLMNWMENAIPELRAARTTYRDMSKPVSQMDIGQELLTRLEPALNDFGALGRETGNKYALALRNADQTARKATKFKGAGMVDVMEPAQMDTLGAIAKDLARKANAQDLGRGPGSDTFQKLALSNIAQSSGAPQAVGGALDLPGVSRVAKFLYSAPEEQIQTVIAKALLEPQMAAQLMRQAAAQGGQNAGRNLLFANPAVRQPPYRVAPVIGAQ